jgi:membrane peptidoglycan carboxypeptidase
LFALVLLLFLGGLVAAGMAYASLTAGLPPVEQVEQMLDPGSGVFLQPTRLYDRTGQHLLMTLENPGIPRRYLRVDPAKPDHFSPELVRVAIALVDPDFWRHGGYGWHDLRSSQPTTIAERLAVNLLLSQEADGARKALRMRILAAQLVSRYGRPQVLEWYLNSAFFGRLSYGAESAARLYLDKSAEELTLADSALLIPLIAAPALNPIDAPAAALERRNTALDLLLEQGSISEVEHERSSSELPRLRESSSQDGSAAPAFTAIALEQAAAALGRARLERGGLRIITTLDMDLQTQASCLLEVQIHRLTGRTYPAESDCQAARLLPTLSEGSPVSVGLSASAVLLDPRSGQVLALVGDGEGESLRAHPAGGLLAPFAAVAGFTRGYGPASLVWDIPPPDTDAELLQLEVHNYRGPLRLRQAIANDVLEPQMELVDSLGAPYVWRLSASLGLVNLAEERDPAVLLAGPALSPLEIAAGYAVFAAQGTANGQRRAAKGSPGPNLLLYIEDAEEHLLLDTSQTQSQTLLSPNLAYLVHHILSDEPARWPSLGFPNPLEIGRPGGAKTSLVLADSQTWAAGYTPQRLAVIWMGLPQEKSGRLERHYAAGVWHAMMQYALRDQPVEDWNVPAGISRVSVCDPSGLLPTAACPAVVDEVFLSGNEPMAVDTLFRPVQVNRETRRLATVFTPPTLVEERVFLSVPPEAKFWAEAAGVPLAPEIYDIILPPEPSATANLETPSLFAYVTGQVQIRGSATGDDFVSYRLQAGQGLNPETWLQIGDESRQAVEGGLLGIWDTSGLDGLYALRLVVVRADSRVETAISQVTVDNAEPRAYVTYPANEQRLPLSDNPLITFLAEAEDEVGIARVEWVLDGQIVATNPGAPYYYAWKATTGRHTLAVRAYDPAGNSTTSSQTTFFVER